MAQQKGKLAFQLPKLPPKIDYSTLVEELNAAHAALARLDETLLHQITNPVLLEQTFFTQEAVLSSQIEGTQATLEEVFEKEAEGTTVEQKDKKSRDIREIINYRQAFREGIRIIQTGGSLSENTVKKLHAILLHSARGQSRAPGEFRRVPVYIAPPGTPITEATYVPPDAGAILDLYSDFDRYLNTESAERDPLVQIAIAHYQFEAIHPFLDGNGRVGRLLIPLFLHKRKILSRPFFSISKYLEQHRREYYDLLADVSYKHAWVPWLRFFLHGLSEQARDANALAHKIMDLRARYQEHLAEFNSAYAFDLLEAIFVRPIFTTTLIRKQSGIRNAQTLLNLIAKFVKAGILQDISPHRKRNKIYAFVALRTIIREYNTGQAL